MVPDLLVLALDFYRAPLRYPELTKPERPLPHVFNNQVGALAGAISPQSIKTTAQALHTNPSLINRASRFFLRQVLMAPGSDHYRVLGLAPDASEETIREHYHLLVRVFHPDRSNDDRERDAEYTARINKAYNILRKPDTRQRYDLKLASAGQRRGSALSHKYRAQRNEPVAPNERYRRAAARFSARNRRLRLLLALGGIAATLGMAFLLWTSSTRPVLRTNPRLADAAIAEPSFLRQSTAPQPVFRFTPPPESSPERIATPAQDGAQRQAQPPEIAKKSHRGARLPLESASTSLPGGAIEAPDTTLNRQQENPPLDDRLVTREKEQGPVRGESSNTATVRQQPHPEHLIADLSLYYQTGDLKRILSLFTANAEVNDGSGISFIESDYGSLFSRTDGRRLLVRNLTWKRANDGNIIGKGTYTSGTKERANESWRYSTGTLQIELAPSNEGYKISKLFHRNGMRSTE